jgi:hypothetical protein
MKYYLHFIFVVLITVGNCTHTFAQSASHVEADTNFSVPFAQPAKVSYSIPIKIRDLSVSHTTGNVVYDASYGYLVQKNILLSDSGYQIQHYSADNKITLFSWQNSDFMSSPRRLIEFTIDTINSKLLNIHIVDEVGSHGSSYHDLDSFTISSVFYEITSGHHLVASLNGAELMGKIFNVDYNYRTTSSDNRGGYDQEEQSLISIISDTQKFSFSLDLSSTDPVFGVSKQKNIITPFRYINTQNLGFIEFSFAPSFQSRMIKIFDIMGREVYNANIGPEQDTYLLDNGSIAPGVYFAILEKETLKVVVLR